MATRVNMLKFLQESRNLADFTTRHPQPRVHAAMAVPLRFTNSGPFKKKRVIRVRMHSPPDIPEPVPIRVLDPLPTQATA
jgi:hypothetical protein